MGDKSKRVREATVRRLRAARLSPDERAFLRARAFYEGSPLHKKDPKNDFGLTPPANPRPDKTLCDEAEVFELAVARDLFDRALDAGLVSESETGTGYPKQIWVVDEAGQVFELIFGGSREGAYHGYPIRASDPLSAELQRAWAARS
jgi:hypothetical protein